MPLSDVDVIDFPGFPTAVVRFRDLPMGEMPHAMDTAFTALKRAMDEQAFAPSGPAFSRYESAPGETVTFEAGFPVDAPLKQTLTAGEVTVVSSELPACRLAIAKHTGPYDRLGESWQEFMGHLEKQGYTPGLPFWEAYDTEPTPETDPETLITGLAVPVTP